MDYKYAQNTAVTAARSRAEIERILQKAGADEFGYITNKNVTQIAFRLKDRMLRFSVPVPKNVKDPEKEMRRKWRVLALSIKSKLVAVREGTSFEEEFLAHIVIPGDGRTLGEAMIPELDNAYKTRTMPKLLSSIEDAQ